MKKRKFIPVNFDSSNRLAVLGQLSPEAQNFLNESIPKHKSIKLSVEIDSYGEMKICSEDEHWEQLAREAGIQLRIDMLVGGYHVRKVDFSKLHQVGADDLDRMVDALMLADGNHVLDLMCGYGALAERILENTRKKAISVILFCGDLYLEQIQRIKDTVKSQVSDIRITDARYTTYPDSFFDAVAIKMGVHDVPRSDQSLIFDEVYRILKPGGRFVIWEVLTDRSDQQDAFSAQIVKKDELAGYESFIIDRYFLRPDQVYNLYAHSGFCYVEEIFCAHFLESSKSRLDSELHSDVDKLKELNQYIRQCTPEVIRKDLQYHDEGDSISMVLPNRIYRGIKPI